MRGRYVQETCYRFDNCIFWTAQLNTETIARSNLVLEVGSLQTFFFFVDKFFGDRLKTPLLTFFFWFILIYRQTFNFGGSTLT